MNTVTLDSAASATARNLLRYCEAEREWVLETTMALARLESPTSDKTAVDRCGEELARRLRAIGGAVTRLRQSDVGDQLRAEFGSGTSQVLLIGHFDTVWPMGQIDRMPLEIRDGCLFGPGVLDMKGGIALGMLAACALTEVVQPADRLVMLWTTDEERGSGTSRALIEEVIVLATHGGAQVAREQNLRDRIIELQVADRMHEVGWQTLQIGFPELHIGASIRNANDAVVYAAAELVGHVAGNQVRKEPGPEFRSYDLRAGMNDPAVDGTDDVRVLVRGEHVIHVADVHVA